MVEYKANIQVEGVGGNNESAINALNRLIEQRSEALHQTVFQATSAIAVNCLRSIRALTLDARKHKKFNIQVEDTPYYVGYSWSEKKPCLRSGMSKTAPKVTLDARVVFLTAGISNPMKNARVYKVTYEKESIKPIYIACASKSKALEFAEKATKHRIDAKGTLGKNALGVAMQKIAAKSLPLDGSSRSQALASQLAKVIENKSGGEYTLVVQDNLDYATGALKGGEGAINTALQNAANKSYGTLAHLAGIDFTKQFPSKPFPEVK